MSTVVTGMPVIVHSQDFLSQSCGITVEGESLGMRVIVCAVLSLQKVMSLQSLAEVDSTLGHCVRQLGNGLPVNK